MSSESNTNCPHKFELDQNDLDLIQRGLLRCSLCGSLGIGPQQGPQFQASQSAADILVMGGAAGGGKSFWLLLEASRHVHRPGYGAIIFRRTKPEIKQQGGLWEKSHLVYPYLAGTASTGALNWDFPAGSNVRCGYMQYEDDKRVHQGSQIAGILFDELTHFSESQFFYMMSRNRSTSGVRPFIRATCNPQPGWVANFLSWWIDPETGFPIQERGGVLRWMARDGDKINWYDSQDEAMTDNQHLLELTDGLWRPKSVTFVPSRVENNPALLAVNPEYVSDLLSLPKIERMRLYDGNWKIAAGSVIDYAWIRKFEIDGEAIEFTHAGQHYRGSKRERFAIIDTAGTSKQKAAEKKGKPPSLTCSAVVEYESGADVLLVRDVWRDRVSWNEMKDAFPEFLDKWNVQTVLIENAHFGQVLFDELRGRYQCKLVGPTVKDMMSGRGNSAKLERATASKLLSRFEFGKILFSPDPECWPESLTTLLTSWTGLDDETADLIDVLSYASDYKRKRQGLMVSIGAA